MTAVNVIGERARRIAIGDRLAIGLDEDHVGERVKLRIITLAWRCPDRFEIPAGGRSPRVELGRILKLFGGQPGHFDVANAEADSLNLSRRILVEIGIADRAKCTKPDQPADTAAALHAAGRIGIADLARIVVPDQPADIVAARNAASRIGIADHAVSIVPDQPADTAAALHAAGCIGIADHAQILTDQPANIVVTRHAATLKTDIAHDRTVIGKPEQANVIGTETIDRQPADHMAVTVKRACETRTVIPDRYEAARAPNAGTGHLAVGGAGIDIAGKPVACGKIGAHQRQLVQVGNRDHPIHGRCRF